MKKARGFTLLEFIIYFALLATVMTTITSFTLSIITAQAKGKVIAEVETGTRLALARILRAVRTADSVNAGGSTFDADNGVLSLNNDSTGSATTTFDLVGGAVRIRELGTTVPLTTSYVNVSKLRFIKDSQTNGDVTISVQITGNYVSTNADRNFVYIGSTSGTAMIRKQGT